MGKGYLGAVVAALAALALAGCTGAGSSGDDDSEAHQAPGTEVPSAEVTGAAEVTAIGATLPAPLWLYRVDLVRDEAGTVSLDGVTSVEVDEMPLPGLAGEYWAFARSGSNVASVVPLVFPRDGHGSTLDAEGGLEHEDFALESSTASVFVAAEGVDGISVVSPDGGSVLEIAGSELPPLVAERVIPENTAKTSQSLSLAALKQRYRHITFLAPGGEAKLPKGVYTGAVIVTPTDAQNDVIADGLAKLTPAVRAAVRNVGVAYWPPGSKEATGLMGRSAGSHFLLNRDLMLNADGTKNANMIYSIVHEAAHCFTFLVDSHQEWVPMDLDPDAWPTDATKAAQALVDKYRLAQGFTSVWQELHETGMASGVTSGYLGDSWESLASEEAARAAGFATRYGAKKPLEDIAEFAATAVIRTPGRGACDAFAGLSELSQGVAIPYGKLTFLTALGAVSSADFSTCVGSVAFKTKPGVDLGVIDFTSTLHAGVLHDGEIPYYGIYAEGPATYQLLIKLPLASETASPLGMHRLDSGWVLQVAKPNRDEILVGNGDDNRLNRASAYGLVLVTEASTASTRGALLGVAFGNGFGEVTDYIPFGTFQVP